LPHVPANSLTVHCISLSDVHAMSHLLERTSGFDLKAKFTNFLATSLVWIAEST